MRKRKRTMAAICIAFLCSAMFAGCGATTTDDNPNDKVVIRSKIAEIKSMNSLGNNEFYVQHGKTYYELYKGYASFSGQASGADPSRVLWFNDDTDWNAIPTLYQGDKLIYHYNDAFDESFTFERFLDLGNTIGVCNMSPRKSGHYEMSTNLDTYSYIDPGSDATQLHDLGNRMITFETIGGTDVRKANVTTSGTIAGLKKGKSYKADVYTGTEMKTFTFTADAHALCSYQVDSSDDYVYMQSRIAEIKIPDYFNSGYYSVNGSGLFRYVKDATSYDDKTDFSKLNVNPDHDNNDKLINEIEQQSSVLSNSTQEAPDTITDIVTIPSDGNYSISILYDDEISDEYKDSGNNNSNTVTAELVANDKTYNFDSAATNNTIMLENVKLQAGTYVLKIYGLKGRGYNYGMQEVDENGNVIKNIPAYTKDDFENAALSSSSDAEADQPTTESNGVVSES